MTSLLLMGHPVVEWSHVHFAGETNSESSSTSCWQSDPTQSSWGRQFDPAPSPWGGQFDPAPSPWGGQFDPTQSPWGGQFDPTHSPWGRFVNFRGSGACCWCSSGVLSFGGGSLGQGFCGLHWSSFSGRLGHWGQERMAALHSQCVRAYVCVRMCVCVCVVLVT